jgi:hypothetical protein
VCDGLHLQAARGEAEAESQQQQANLRSLVKKSLKHWEHYLSPKVEFIGLSDAFRRGSLGVKYGHKEFVEAPLINTR